MTNESQAGISRRGFCGALGAATLLGVAGFRPALANEAASYLFPAPPVLDLPPGRKVTRLDRWRKAWVGRGKLSEREANTRRAAFRPALKNLQPGHVDTHNGFV